MADGCNDNGGVTVDMIEERSDDGEVFADVIDGRDVSEKGFGVVAGVGREEEGKNSSALIDGKEGVGSMEEEKGSAEGCINGEVRLGDAEEGMGSAEE